MDDGHITAVGDGAVPVGSELLLDFHTLGINHQPRGAAVKPVHHVGGASLPRLGKMAVEQ